MTNMETFTLYWRDGERELISGANIADAMHRAGYGSGALAALDFFDYGEICMYSWNKDANEWQYRAPK